MESGTIYFADRVITFSLLDGHIIYTVCDIFTEKREQHTVPASVFAFALALAVHPDGLSVSDYEQMKAQEHMKEVAPELHWIP